MVENYYGKIQNIITKIFKLENIKVTNGYSKYLQYILNTTLLIMSTLLGLIIIAATILTPIYIFFILNVWFTKKIEKHNKKDFILLDKFVEKKKINKEIKEYETYIEKNPDDKTDYDVKHYKKENYFITDEMKVAADNAYCNIRNYEKKMKISNSIVTIIIVVLYIILIMPLVLLIIDIAKKVGFIAGLLVTFCYILAGAGVLSIIPIFIIESDINEYMYKNLGYQNYKDRNCFDNFVSRDDYYI